MSEYVVYMHVNKTNGKKYVGITSQSVNRRWRHGYGYRRNKHFWDAINKYGWDGFEHVIVCSGVSLKTASEKEKQLIKENKTTEREFGYNLSTGGETPSVGIRFSLTENQRRKISNSLSGKPKTEEHKKALSESRKGKPNYKKRKRVLCVETGAVYSGIKEAKEKTNINHISRACNGKLKTAGGFHWEFI